MGFTDAVGLLVIGTTSVIAGVRLLRNPTDETKRTASILAVLNLFIAALILLF